MSDWGAQIEALAKKGAQDIGEVCRAIKIELFSSVVDDTRVDTGRLRGNWSIREGSPNTTKLKRTDKSGSIVKGRIDAVASPDGVTYFTNNLPYAGVYEKKDAMIGKNVARVDQILKKEAAKL